MRIPSVSLDMLVAVVAVAEKKSILRDAQALGISSSAVGKRIRAASELVAARLFFSSEEGLKLTAVGVVFHGEAVKTIEHAVLLEEKTKTHLLLQAHHLLIGHSPYLSPKLLAVLHHLSLDTKPNVHIEHQGELHRNPRACYELYTW